MSTRTKFLTSPILAVLLWPALVSANPLGDALKSLSGPKASQKKPSPAAAPPSAYPQTPNATVTQAGSTSPPTGPNGWQPPPDAPKLIPDVIGVRTGMSIEEATSILKKYNPDGKFSKVEGANHVVSMVNFKVVEVGNDGKSTYENVALTIAPPPVQKVMSIERGVGGKPMVPENVISQLQEKYGPGMVTSSQVSWFFDPNGNREGDCFVTAPHGRKTAFRLCDGYVVTAQLSISGQLAVGVATRIVDLALMKEASAEHESFVKEQNAQRSHDELEKAKGNKTAF